MTKFLVKTTFRKFDTNVKICYTEVRKLITGSNTHSENNILERTINFIMYCNDFIVFNSISLSSRSGEFAFSICSFKTAISLLQKKYHED